MLQTFLPPFAAQGIQPPFSPTLRSSATTLVISAIVPPFSTFARFDTCLSFFPQDFMKIKSSDVSSIRQFGIYSGIWILEIQKNPRDSNIF